jgi:4-alpha-glucanotransferase
MGSKPGPFSCYPNWRVPLSGPDGQPMLLEDVMVSKRAADLVRGMS